MPLYRVHVKFKRGFEDWHLFDEPTVEAAAERARRFGENTGRKLIAEPASIVDASTMTMEEQEKMDEDKPYILDEHYSQWTPEQRAAWERDNRAQADKIGQALTRGDFIPEADRIALAQAKRAAQIRANPGQLKHSDAQHVTKRAVMLAPGEEEPRGEN